MPVLTSTPNTVSSFPTRRLRGSIPSALWLTAYLLAVLRLKLYVTVQPPRTRYPVAGLPSGAGFTPAELHDLARPHVWSDPDRCPCVREGYGLHDNASLSAHLGVHTSVCIFVKMHTLSRSPDGQGRRMRLKGLGRFLPLTGLPQNTNIASLAPFGSMHPTPMHHDYQSRRPKVYDS